jgi:dephospho-CoA kinase
MLKIGLTGGIGSGKSTVCKVFEALTVPVYHADEKAKALINVNPDLKKSIVSEFGPESFNNQGYNTAFIGRLVFNKKELLNTLNRIVHPFVAEDFILWCQANKNYPYTLQETAILFESGAAALMDYSIVVDAPESLRIKRVIDRDRSSKEEVQARISNQWPAEKIRSLADWVIENDDKNLVLPQILKIHNNILKLIKTHA